MQGAALGGGFEALLSFDYIVAEQDATFGLPEILFGLFPGMGAHALLSRKLGSAQADRLIVSNRTSIPPRKCTSSACPLPRAERRRAGGVPGLHPQSRNARYPGLVNARRAMKPSPPGRSKS